MERPHGRKKTTAHHLWLRKGQPFSIVFRWDHSRASERWRGLEADPGATKAEHSGLTDDSQTLVLNI